MRASDSEDINVFGSGGGKLLFANATPGRINATRYALVNRFAAATGLDILMGLNGLTARKSTSSAWDPSLSGEDRLIDFTLRQPYEQYPVAGWELSNELDIKNRPPTPLLVLPSRLAADATALRRRLTAAAQHPSRKRALIFGPDTATVRAAAPFPSRSPV